MTLARAELNEMASRILVVDDEAAIREAIRITLQYEGYEVDEARSGQEGIDRALGGSYDAILLASARLASEDAGVIAALRSLVGRIDAEAMRRMNLAVDEHGEAPRVVARSFLATFERGDARGRRKAGGAESAAQDEGP